MNETLAKFEALASKARTGDTEAGREFFTEAARLFPADFGGDHASVGSESADRLDRVLAIIRQTVSLSLRAPGEAGAIQPVKVRPR